MVVNCVFNCFNTVIVFVTLFETRFDHEFCVLIKVMLSDTVRSRIDFLLISKVLLCDIRITCQVQAWIPVKNAV